ncbi:hypothetical protein IRZ71_10015 [Flavobacterium sp. ANB]|uniref:hypothetical protein n=1 Tax=unclassified Flavobacterium TaxID=196869 RepID=UPI0012B6EEC6|nr:MULTISPECIES: hypothetical protein [unclassified Flavobacterium]MBF4516682.1 hypothetical protein [Flavobacterium sp. ANB]MTD69422.1 hypothetical protein [Flavobacterium sp. LC2016-13]
MKFLPILFLALGAISCHNTDTINHYLTKPINPQVLESNGFYKYSYLVILDDQDKVDDTIRCNVKYDMYSNVKPEKNAEGKLYPTQLWNFFRKDSIKKKRNIDYLKNDLNNRIITYVFINNTLSYKSIIIKSLDKTTKRIADLTTKEKIIKYYDSLKISIKPFFEKNISTEKYTTLFMIDNYRTIIYYNDKDSSYEMFTNYKNNYNYNILEDWYGGRTTYGNPVK